MESLFVKTEEIIDKIKKTSNSLNPTAKYWLSLAILTCYRASKFTAKDYGKSMMSHEVKMLADLGMKDDYPRESGIENARYWNHDPVVAAVNMYYTRFPNAPGVFIRIGSICSRYCGYAAVTSVHFTGLSRSK